MFNKNTNPHIGWPQTALRRAFNQQRRLTHHVKVISAALRAPVEAGQQHVFDVVARSVVELPHVEGPGLVVVEVSPLLQDLQDVFLNQVWVSDLVPGKEGSVLKKKARYSECHLNQRLRITYRSS